MAPREEWRREKNGAVRFRPCVNRMQGHKNERGAALDVSQKRPRVAFDTTLIWNYHEKLTPMASPTPPDALSSSTIPKLVPPRPTAPPSSVTRPAKPRPENDPQSAVDAALDATHRTSTSLSSLLDALGRFTSGINGAQEASEQLKLELFMLRDMLGTSNQERLALKVRVDNLERELEDARHDVEQEQRYVRDEQDRFIAALMDEYEVEIEQLKQMLTATEPVNPAVTSRELRDALESLEVAQAERQHSRELAHRAQRQRDSAQREVARLQHELRVAQTRVTELELVSKFDDQHTRPTEPPPNDGPPNRRASGHGSAASDTDPAPRSPSLPNLDLKLPASALELADFERDWDAAAIPAPPPSFDGAPALATADTQPALRNSAPPAELLAALTAPSGARVSPPQGSQTRVPSPQAAHARISPPTGAPAAAPPTAPAASADETPSIVTNIRTSSIYPDPYRVDAKPPLPRKPDHSLRPLVGYSKRANEVQPEQLGTTPKSERGRE